MEAIRHARPGAHFLELAPVVGQVQHRGLLWTGSREPPRRGARRRGARRARASCRPSAVPSAKARAGAEVLDLPALQLFGIDLGVRGAGAGAPVAAGAGGAARGWRRPPRARRAAPPRAAEDEPLGRAPVYSRSSGPGTRARARSSSTFRRLSFFRVELRRGLGRGRRRGAGAARVRSRRRPPARARARARQRPPPPWRRRPTPRARRRAARRAARFMPVRRLAQRLERGPQLLDAPALELFRINLGVRIRRWSRHRGRRIGHRRLGRHRLGRRASAGEGSASISTGSGAVDAARASMRRSTSVGLVPSVSQPRPSRAALNSRL